MITAAALLLALGGLQAFAAGAQDEKNYQEAAGVESWTHSYDISERPDGKYNVLVRGRDLAGNTSIAGPFNIYIDSDSDLPTVSVANPEEGSIITSNLNVVGAATDDDGIEKVLMSINGGEFAECAGKEYWHSYLELDSLTEGRHTLELKAVDINGLEGPPTALSFTVDKRSPATMIESHASGVYLSGKVEISGSVQDANGVQRLSFREKNRAAESHIKLKYNREKDVYEFQQKIDTEEYEDGPHDLIFTSTDLAGSQGIDSFLFFADNNAPQLQILSPTPDAELNQRILLAGIVRDSVGIKALSYSIGEQEREIELTPGDPYWAAELDLAEYPYGNLSLEVAAEDYAGNISSEKIRLRNSRESDLPQVTLSLPERIGVAEQSIDIAVAARDDDRLQALEYSLDEQPPETIALGSQADAAQLIQLNGLQPGRHSISVRAQDEHGLFGETVKSSFTIPKNPEDVPIEGVSEISLESFESVITGADEVVLEGRGPKGPGDVQIEVRLSGFVPQASHQGAAQTGAQSEASIEQLRSWQPVRVDGSGGFSHPIDAAELPDGIFTFELRSRSVVEDSSDPEDVKTVENSSSMMSSWVKDSRAPQLTLLTPVKDDGVNGKITVAGTASDAGTVSKLELSTDGENFSEIRPACCFVHSLDLSASLAAAGPPSEIIFRTTDANGLTETFRVPVNYDAASDLPQADIQFPLEAAVISEDFTLAGTALDDDGIAAVHYQINDGDWRRTEGRSAFEIPISIRGIEDGAHTIRVKSEDFNGVQSETAARTIVVSRSDPVTRIASPNPADFVKEKALILGTVEDPNGIEAVYVSTDNGASYNRADLAPPPETQAAVETAGADSDADSLPPTVAAPNPNPSRSRWSYSLDAGLLKDGTHSVYVKAVDAAGVESLYTSIINVDNTIPHIKLDSPLANSETNGRLELGGRISDNTALTRVKVTLVPLDEASGRVEHMQNDSENENQAGEETSTSTATEGRTDRLEVILLGADAGQESSENALGQTTNPYQVGADLSADKREVHTKVMNLNRSLDTTQLRPGWYNINLEATDLAGNTAYETRNTLLVGAEKSEELDILYPLEGETASVFAKIEGRSGPQADFDSVVIVIDDRVVTTAAVKDNGYFSATLDNSQLSLGEHTLQVRSDSAAAPVNSAPRHFTYKSHGPWVLFEGLESGDFLTERTFITGTTGYQTSSGGTTATTDSPQTPALDRLEVSFDNGRSFQAIEGQKVLSKRRDGDWKLRIETQNYPDGYLPVVAKSYFADGSSAVAKVRLQIDKTPPNVVVQQPTEDSRFNGLLTLAGIADDANGMDSVHILFREGDKDRYQVPSFVQGLYIDLHALGATYGEYGMGLTFFDDNVKLQASAGLAPPGRFTGLVLSGTLLANIATIPYSYLFGPDWQAWSMAVAVGSKFSYFTMSEDSYSFTGEGVILGSVLGQWEFLRYTAPDLNAFDTYSLYLEGALWFISSDVQAGLVPRISIGTRIGVF